jgi:hypothetical protein
MTMSPENLYLQLRRLVATTPDLADGPITPEINLSLGRLVALLEASSGANAADIKSLTVSVEGLGTTIRNAHAQRIAAIVYRALARAELEAPASAHGSFIFAGDELDAFAAVAKVLERAKKDILMVDRYADHIITDFAVTAPEGVPVRILGGNKEARKQTMRPAVERWAQQHGAARPLEVRVLRETKLHDRLIVIDGVEAWSPHQSFNGMAKSSHTSIERSYPELAAMKVEAYEEMWKDGEPL